MESTLLASTPKPATEAFVSPCFTLQGKHEKLICDTPTAVLPRGDTDSLAERVSQFFDTHTDGAPLLVGALPFERRAPDYLFQPHRVRQQPLNVQAPRHPDYRWQLTDAMAPAHYADAVRRALPLFRQLGNEDSNLHKLVLARYIELLADRPIDTDLIAAQLTDRHATTFNMVLPERDTTRIGQRRLVGASPELLVAKQGSRVTSCPLAGTARRHDNAIMDKAAAQELLHSDKDLREHRAASEAVLDALAPYCKQLSANQDPELVATERLWHLGTPIKGELKNRHTQVAELAAALHPTPAVCGLPRSEAYEHIRRLEGFDRDFYAGAVGWADAAGDGAWYVTIRCADIQAERVRLYAGAGIVLGSDPAKETRETAAKFGVMLKALGIDSATLNTLMKEMA